MGIPLCFFLSLVARCARLFRRQELKKPKKIVFLGLTEIGAGIMAYPSIQKMRSTWKDANAYLWVFKDNVDFFRATRWFPEDHLIVMRSDSFLNLATDFFRNLIKLHKLRIDAIVDLEASTRLSSLLCYLSGAAIRIGFYSQSTRPFYRGQLYTHQVAYDPSRHISRNYHALVRALLSSVPPEAAGYPCEAGEDLSLPKIRTSTEEDQKLQDKLCELGGFANHDRRLVLVHLGLNDRLPIRRWPLEYYQQLMERLLSHPKTIILLVGTGAQRTFSREGMAEPRIINLIGKTNARELFSLLNRATVLVSHDSGIVHIAALTDIPTIALFGPETPNVFGPLSDRKKVLYKNFNCSPCLLVSNYKQSPCRDNQCIRAITADEVYAEVMKVLS